MRIGRSRRNRFKHFETNRLHNDIKVALIGRASLPASRVLRLPYGVAGEGEGVTSGTGVPDDEGLGVGLGLARISSRRFSN